MPRDLRTERHFAHEIGASDEWMRLAWMRAERCSQSCKQGRMCDCVPDVSEGGTVGSEGASETSWFLSDLCVIGIGGLCLIGFICGVF
jgi:hypothetical protein